MQRYRTMIAVSLTLCLSLGAAGCNQSDTPSTGGESAGTGAGQGSEHMGPGDVPDSHMMGGSGPGGTEEEPEWMGEVSPADRTAIQEQGICPVSGKELGSMGKPIKLTVKDQEVWICCEVCREKLLANPAKYMAERNEQ